jgi:hypothetical protein
MIQIIAKMTYISIYIYYDKIKLSAYALPAGLSVPRVGRGLRAGVSVRRSPLDLAVVPSCSSFLKRCFPDGCFFVTDDSGHEIRDSLIACV